MWKRLKTLTALTDVRQWHVRKLKLIDARLYFISIFVGLLTGLITVPYHYLLQYFFRIRSDFFHSEPRWYWYIPLFIFLWGILNFVSWLVEKMPYITGGGIPQTRGVINGRITYKHPFIEMVSKFVGGVLALSAGLSLGREGPSVQIGSYIGSLFSRWGKVLAGEQKQLLAAGAGAGLAAAFAAPLASSLLVIETIERFDAPKTAITTMLAGVVAGGVASWLFPMNPYALIEVIKPILGFWELIKLFLVLAILISVFGKIYAWLALFFRRVYPKIKQPSYIKMFYLLSIAFTISYFVVDLTGGGEEFLITQSTNGSTAIGWLTLMMVIHLFFTLISISTGLPGGSFIPTLVTGGLFGRIVGLVLVNMGYISMESVNYIMLVCMSSFLVAVVRTPLTAIVLITEITGQFEVFYPSIVVGGLTYYITELFQIKPFNVSLYDEMIKTPAFQAQTRYNLSVEIMTGSYMDGRTIEELQLPKDCKIIKVSRDRKDLDLTNLLLLPGDQVQIEMNAQDIEKLYEPLVSLANIY